MAGRLTLLGTLLLALLVDDQVRQYFAEAVPVRPDGLGIIGGETGLQLLRQLRVRRLMVHGRISEVIAHGVMADGVMSGCPLVTKGGSVGPEAAVVQMIDYLLGETSA